LNNYYFNDAINTLAANGFQGKFFNFLNQGKINTMALDRKSIKISTYHMGTVVGASGAIYGVIVAFALCFLMLN
jgi:membrane associated rhomboid family serine protease